MRQLKISQSMTDKSAPVQDYLRDISRIPMISPDEEFELALRAQKGDEDAKNRLVESNLRFVVSVAKQYQNRGVDLSDLINEGNIGLIKGVEHFDPTRGFHLISYAVWWIRQQIVQSLNEQADAIRLPLNKIGRINQLLKAKNTFVHENERDPSVSELADMVGLDEEQVETALKDQSSQFSIDAPLSDDSDASVSDMMVQECFDDPDKKVNDESLQNELTSAMKVLDERESNIIRLSFGIGCEEVSLEEIACQMDPIPGAIDAVHKLAEKYDCYILSTAPWANPSSWADKVNWVTKNLDDVFHKKLILTHHKNLLNDGEAYLIDDRTKHGADEFGVRHVHFGSKDYPDWQSVLDKLL